MILKTQITQTKEIEITLPVFFKEDTSYDSYLAVLNDQTCIDLYVSKSGDCVIITHTTPDKKSMEIQRAHEKWLKVSEIDFLQAYDDALSAISLRGKLHEQDFVTDLNLLDLKRNGG